VRAAALALAVALAAPGMALAQAPLAGTQWELVELRSPDNAIGLVRVRDSGSYTLAFEADGSVALRLDCNRGRGTWRSEAPGRLEFGPAAVTRAMCPPGSLDGRVARELSFVRVYAIQGDMLRLELMADGGQQVWRRVTP
jgi:para-nitrobenzyl esterase